MFSLPGSGSASVVSGFCQASPSSPFVNEMNVQNPSVEETTNNKPSLDLNGSVKPFVNFKNVYINKNVRVSWFENVESPRVFHCWLRNLDRLLDARPKKFLQNFQIYVTCGEPRNLVTCGAGYLEAWVPGTYRLWRLEITDLSALEIWRPVCLGPRDPPRDLWRVLQQWANRYS